MWHDDEESRTWHDGDVTPWDWHCSTKDMRDQMDVLVVKEGARYPEPFVVRVWLDTDTEHFSSPCEPQHGTEWPPSWRWAPVWRVIAASGEPMLGTC